MKKKKFLKEKCLRKGQSLIVNLYKHTPTNSISIYTIINFTV